MKEFTYYNSLVFYGGGGWLANIRMHNDLVVGWFDG